MRIRLIALLVGVALGVGPAVAGALSVEADKPPPVGAHRHYQVTSSGAKAYIGPDFCEVNASAQGFAAFHHKVHVTDPGSVDVLSEPCN